jgi:hypothetical protein
MDTEISFLVVCDLNQLCFLNAHSSDDLHVERIVHDPYWSYYLSAKFTLEVVVLILLLMISTPITVYDNSIRRPTIGKDGVISRYSISPQRTVSMAMNSAADMDTNSAVQHYAINSVEDAVAISETTPLYTFGVGGEQQRNRYT